MLSKVASVVVIVVVVAGLASAASVGHGSPKALEANQLRSIAAAGRNKRSSYGILPGKLRYENANMRR
jgi:hypothetical protein